MAAVRASMLASSRGMRCDGSGASVFDGELACSECGRELTAAPTRAEATPPPSEPRLEPTLLAEEPPPPAEAARCPEHPELLSVATCARCGRFCCVRCVPEAVKGAVCPACQRRVRIEANPVELKRLRREVKVSFFFATLAALGFSLGPALLVGGRTNWTWLVLGSGLTVVLGLCAVLVATTERALFAWVAIVFEMLGARAMFVVVAGKCLSWPLLVFPVVTALRLNKWRGLEAEARALASEAPRG